MDDEMELEYQVAFELIAVAGDSKAESMAAINAAAEFNFEEAQEHLKVADERMVAAHEIQTEMLQNECRGQKANMAFSYYASNTVTTHQEGEKTSGNMMDGGRNPYLEASPWGWQIDPDGLKRALHELYDRYQIPLLIIENGLGTFDTLEPDGSVHDSYRIDYMSRHIAAMKEAVEEGVNLIGYTMWACIDLVSASTGELRKRYGFIYVDADDEGGGTFKRYKKDSFDWYKKVIESNGEVL